MMTFLYLQPFAWRNSLRGVYEEDEIQSKIWAQCNIERKRNSDLYIKGMSEPALFQTQLHIHREYKAGVPLHIAHPWLFKEEPLSIAPNLMEPEDGQRPPFGTIVHVESWFDQDLGEGPDAFEIHLYPGTHVFDELWTRLRHGGALPNRVTLRLHGVEDGTLPDEVFWDTAQHKSLPITEFDFDCEVKIEPL